MDDLDPLARGALEAKFLSQLVGSEPIPVGPGLDSLGPAIEDRRRQKQGFTHRGAPAYLMALERFEEAA